VSFVVYLTGLGLIAAVAWAAASPLLRPPRSLPTADESPADARWRRRKEEALAGIRDAEFDHRLGKLSAEDYRDLRARLEMQALEAIAELEGEGHGQSR
jgi:hypothetical protein